MITTVPRLRPVFSADALREDRPGIHSELGLDQQRDPEAEQHAAGHQTGGPLQRAGPRRRSPGFVTGAGGAVVRKRLKATPAQISSTTPKGQVPARKP